MKNLPVMKYASGFAMYETRLAMTSGSAIGIFDRAEPDKPCAFASSRLTVHNGLGEYHTCPTFIGQLTNVSSDRARRVHVDGNVVLRQLRCYVEDLSKLVASSPCGYAPKLWVRPRIANFDAAYADVYGMPMCPASEYEGLEQPMQYSPCLPAIDDAPVRKVSTPTRTRTQRQNTDR